MLQYQDTIFCYVTENMCTLFARYSYNITFDIFSSDQANRIANNTNIRVDRMITRVLVEHARITVTVTVTKKARITTIARSVIEIDLARNVNVTKQFREVVLTTAIIEMTSIQIAMGDDIVNATVRNRGIMKEHVSMNALVTVRDHVNEENVTKSERVTETANLAVKRDTVIEII